MPNATLLPPPRMVLYDANGNPLAGGYVHTYVPGGTTLATTWQDAAGTIPNANPIILDSAGSCLLLAASSIQLTVTDAAGVAVPAYSGVTYAPAYVSPALLPVVGATTLGAAKTALGISPAIQPVLSAATLSGSRIALLPTGATHAPTTRGSSDSILTAFTGDLSQCGWAFGYTISGTATLGQPTTGYLYTPENSMYYDYLLNLSGWNESTSIADGRTAATCHFTRIDNYGQGDCMGYIVAGFVASARAGATSWLANCAITAYAADMNAGANHVYLNPRETNVTDHGYDCSAIGDVTNMWRTVATAALGDPWIAYRAQSLGSAFVDAFLSALGNFTLGMDLSTATFGAAQAAITLAEGQRIYFGAVNSDTATHMPRGTNPTGSYVQQNAGVLTLTNGSGQLQIGAANLVTVGALQIGGACTPTADNTYALGGSSARWSQLYAGTATINTSDEREKQDVGDIPAAVLDAWDALAPRAYKMVGAVAAKGDAARHHTGYIAQAFAAALSAQGLVPAEWAAWCSDVLDDGSDRQGLRYDELFTIADAANRRRMGRMEARLAALEAAG